jgi:hypothetical protein
LPICVERTVSELSGPAGVDRVVEFQLTRRVVRGARVRRERDADDAGDRLAAVAGDRDVDPHAVRPLADVELPADPREGEPEPHQKLVAEIGIALGIRRGAAAIERADRGPVAAVRHFDQHAAVAASRIFRTNDIPVGRELHASGRRAGSLVEVDDHSIARVLGIDAEVDGAGHLLVAGLSDVGALADLHARHFGARGARPADRQRQQDPRCGDSSRVLCTTVRGWSG